MNKTISNFSWQVAQSWGVDRCLADHLEDSLNLLSKDRGKVRIAIVDRGIATSHPRLSLYCCVPAVFRMGDFYHSMQQAYYEASHGTACAGLVVDIFESPPNESLPSGQRSLEIVPVALPARYDDTALTACLKWSASHADIVLTPWTTEEWIADQVTVENAFAKGRDGKGTIWIAPTGNQGRAVVPYPARFTCCMGVGSVTSDGFIAAYTNHGRGLDILAPGSGGSNQLTALNFIDSQHGGSKNHYRIHQSELREFSGTSGSASLVAGAIGLLLSVDPEITQTTLMQWIREPASDASESSNVAETPRLNISKLLAQIGSI